jgi:hypothetical protein
MELSKNWLIQIEHNTVTWFRYNHNKIFKYTINFKTMVNILIYYFQKILKYS